MVGHTISHFEIFEKLGEGGMGVVYRARDVRLDRVVALKVLSSEQAVTPAQRLRFIREAKAASALNHSNIVTIHEIETVDGLDYIAMEYVRGATLREAIPSTGLPLADALKYAIEIASALCAAHAAGIVHRDIKPANIMITAQGSVKLLDFGLAIVDPQFAADDRNTATIAATLLTRPGTVIGTVAYMSPEQAQGRSVDARSDIFSFGVVFHQMLTGASPFQAESQIGLLFEIVNKPAPQVTRGRPDLPVALDRILLTALEKDPQRRYQRVNDLLSDLKDLSRELAGGGARQQISLRAGSARAQIWRRNANIFALTAGLFLAAGLLWKMEPQWFNRVPAEKKIAVLPFRNIGGARENEAFCDGLMEAVSTGLTELSQFHGSLWVVPASEIMREGLASPKEALRSVGANLVITGSVQREHDQVLLTANLVDATSLRQVRSKEIRRMIGEVAELQDSIVREIAAMLDLALAETERHTLEAGQTSASGAYDLYLRARGHLQRRAPDDLDDAIRMFQQAIELDRKYALAYAGLGEAYWQKYRETSDTQWVGPARKNCQMALSLNGQIAPVYLTLGIIEEGAGNHQQALDALERARRLEPANPVIYTELGTVHDAMGQSSQAEANFKTAAQLRPGDWTSLNSLGVFYYRRGLYVDAIPLFRNVTRLAPGNSQGYTNLGAAYAGTGQYQEAAASFRQSLGLRSTANAYTNLGTVDFFLGHCTEAIPLMEQASRLAPGNERIWGNLGDAYACVPGRKGEADSAYKRAVQLGQKRLEVNPRDGEIVSSVALYEAKLGDKTRALERISKARRLAPESRKVAWESALVFELSGNRGRALEALRLALREGQPPAEVRGEPALADLRRDPRFEPLMAEWSHR